MDIEGRTVVAGAAIIGAVVLGGGAAFIYSGAYNVAATAGHTPLVHWLLNTTQERSVAARIDDVPEPPRADSAMLAHGFEHFSQMCVVCHGAPGVERGDFGRGMTPTPPDLAEQAAEFSSRELFWITKHGIKLAGMPAFGPTHSDEELWGIVAFVEELPGMTGNEYAVWQANLASAGGEEGAGAGHPHAPGTSEHHH